MRLTSDPHRTLDEVDPEAVRRLREVIFGTLAKHTSDEPDLRRPVADTWRRAVGIAVPALAVNGALDAADHLEMAARLTRRLPGGRTVSAPARRTTRTWTTRPASTPNGAC
ncbi:hypothetical protein [Streptomyces sp. NPDC031705]|uniref:hypothetical protein n=1 Tax=Streptomyces sp. NPDC031705 TaxID=3155729 RepID=UPI00340ED273